jgi:hypothetical protein
VLRDAFLWAFPDLPDPFLSFQASALNSSTKTENAILLGVLDRVMIDQAAYKCAPAWATEPYKALPQWKEKFRARWDGMTLDQRERRYRTTKLTDAEHHAWERVRRLVQIRCGRPEMRAGRIRFTSSEITKALHPLSDERTIVEGAMHGKGLNPISLGRWLKDRLVDAPINGFVLRSAKDRTNTERFWIERSKKDA